MSDEISTKSELTATQFVQLPQTLSPIGLINSWIVQGRWMMCLLILFLGACNLTNNPQEAIVTDAVIQEITVSYYAFSTDSHIPMGSINLSGVILVPKSSTIQSDDMTEMLRQSLELAINDSNNLWTSENLEISSIHFDGGHANIALNGEIWGVGGLVLYATSSQFLLTIFANPQVQTAVVTLNGENIRNLGISHISQAKEANYVFTREEIQIFLEENSA